ncbi:MAG: alpha/beta fold hydrolase [Gammaproteobacteria bacterium]|nr:alpha/beta fold hydrolase [Gammaproteobacteria bacterium]
MPPGGLTGVTVREEARTLSGTPGPDIHLYVWHPDGEGNGDAVQIVHGLGEHAGRYRRLAESLTAAGYLVLAHDQRGHGRTAQRGVPGHFADREGWDRVIEDVERVRREAKALRPDGRLILLGHSMGSYVAQSNVLRAPASVDALVLSGSTFASRAQLRVFRIVAAIEKFRQGATGRSALLDKLSFGAFNKEFQPARTEFDWLSRDEAEVDSYVTDPLCGGRSTNQLWRDLTGGLLEITSVAALRQLPVSLPVYILGGEKDPVGGAKGLTRLHDAYREAGLAGTQLRLYPEGRHEMFNETNRDEVSADLLAWLRSPWDTDGEN